MKQIKLKVGENTRIGSIFTGLYITYCGMNSEDNFSIGLREGAGHRGYSFNLYFSTKNRLITIKNRKFNVIKASNDELIIEEYGQS